MVFPAQEMDSWPSPAPAFSDSALTNREREVLRLLAEGVGNKEIAWRLSITEHTVKFHVSSLMTKLNAGSRTEAVTQGIRRGYVAL
jgi:DNA-binding NarL/FixJ family response regulator